MPTFIKTGYWEKIQKGYKGWLNLDDVISNSIGIGTSGQITFWDSTGKLSGNDNLFWNNTSGRLGIGLTTPAVKLHIYDNSVGDTVYVENNGGTPSIQTYYRNNNVNPTAGANLGALLFASYFNSTYSPPAQEVAGIFGVYWGNGTNRAGGVDIRTYNGGGQNVSVRVNNLGNVLIGGTFADSGHKLQVLGSASFSTQAIIGSNTAINASAALQIDSTTRGFLPSRVTTAEKNAITTPAAGLVVYDTTLNKLCVYTGAAWQTVSSA